MKFTEEEMQLLSRHYTKIKIFSKVFLWWDTSPRAVLRHLQELEVKNIVQPDVIKSVCECDYPLGKCEKGKICERCNEVIEW